MEEDQRLGLDVLLKYGLIEANNRVDEYADTIDSIRVTAYGRYLFNDLCSAFTYIDLVSTDTAIHDSRVAAELASLGMEEYEIWEGYISDSIKRVERVEKRISKALEFINYLQREEEREAEAYNIPIAERFVPRISMRLEEEIENVRRSAARQRFQ